MAGAGELVVVVGAAVGVGAVVVVVSMSSGDWMTWELLLKATAFFCLVRSFSDEDVSAEDGTLFRADFGMVGEDMIDRMMV